MEMKILTLWGREVFPLSITLFLLGGRKYRYPFTNIGNIAYGVYPLEETNDLIEVISYCFQAYDETRTD